MVSVTVIVIVFEVASHAPVYCAPNEGVKAKIASISIFVQAVCTAHKACALTGMSKVRVNVSPENMHDQIAPFFPFFFEQKHLLLAEKY